MKFVLLFFGAVDDAYQDLRERLRELKYAAAAAHDAKKRGSTGRRRR